MMCQANIEFGLTVLDVTVIDVKALGFLMICVTNILASLLICKGLATLLICKGVATLTLVIWIAVHTDP